MVKYDDINRSKSNAGGKLVKKLSKGQKVVKISKIPQRSEKFAKAINLEKYLPKYQSSVN